MAERLHGAAFGQQDEFSRSGIKAGFDLKGAC